MEMKNFKEIFNEKLLDLTLACKFHQITIVDIQSILNHLISPNVIEIKENKTHLY